MRCEACGIEWERPGTYANVPGYDACPLCAMGAKVANLEGERDRRVRRERDLARAAAQLREIESRVAEALADLEEFEGKIEETTEETTEPPQ